MNGCQLSPDVGNSFMVLGGLDLFSDSLQTLEAPHDRLAMSMLWSDFYFTAFSIRSSPFLSTHKVNSLLDHIISSLLFDNIKILSGQLNPSSISDLIVMVLLGIPLRPPAAFAALYDT